MSRNSTECLRTSIHEVQSMIETNPWLASILSRAFEHPATIVTSTISDHPPSHLAVALSKEFGIAEVTLEGPEASTKAEGDHYKARLAEILRVKKERKAEKISDQIAKLQGKLRDRDTKQKSEKLKAKLAEIKCYLENQGFLATAERNLSGVFASVWSPVSKTYAGEYQAVAGGADCPSAEFIRALLFSTAQSLGRLSSNYVLAGPIIKGMRISPTEWDGDERFFNKILAITDPALEPEPSPEQRADATFATAQVMEQLFPEAAAKIAMISFSTGCSGRGESVNVDRTAYEQYKKKYPNSSYPAYGPMQWDAAVYKPTAESKLPSFIRALKEGTTDDQKLAQQELEAYQQVAGSATILSLQNLTVGNPLAKALRGCWGGSVEMGPLILAPKGIFAETGEPMRASDLSRGEDEIGIFFTFAALSILTQANQVK